MSSISERLRNMRSLGGLPTTDGRRVAERTLYRAAAPLRGCGAELAALDLNVVVDLRGQEEAQKHPTEIPAGVRLIAAPIEQPVDERALNAWHRVLAGLVLDYSTEDLAALLTEMVDGQPDRLGAAISHLAQPDALPALVHCGAGKDRTGLVIAFVLTVAGVQRDAVLRDFERSTAERADRGRAHAEELAAVGTTWERVAPMFLSPAAALEAVLDHVDRRYGGVRGYLTDAAGCTPGELDQLTNRVLPSADGQL